jgi:tetratricopeptide (TPR) repeat protein
VRSIAAQGRREEALALAESLAASAEAAEDLAAAATLLQLVTELDPSNGAARVDLGRVWALSQKHASATTELTRAVSLGHDGLETLFYLGSSLWESGRVEEAREVFDQALRRFGRHPVVLTQLGRLLVWSGHHSEAVGPLEEAVRLDPEDSLLRIDLARALDGAGDTERALEAYRRAVASAPEHAEIRYVLARLLRQVGEVEQAEEELAAYQELYRVEQERTRSIGLERATLDRGRDLLRRGEPVPALEFLESQPQTPDVLSLMARALSASGNVEAAVAALDQALRAAPEREDFRSQLRELRVRSSEQ